MNKAKLTKKRIKAIETHVNNISEMGRCELGAFDEEMYKNKQDIDEVVWKWVNKAVIKHSAYLMDIDVQSGGAMAIMSELKMGEC